MLINQRQKETGAFCEDTTCSNNPPRYCSMDDDDNNTAAFRLSMAGLDADPVDTLRSERYSRKLECLRAQIVTHLPQTEDILSKAILDAFSFSLPTVRQGHQSDDPRDVESFALQEAHAWVDEAFRRGSYTDKKEATLEFFRVQVENMVVRVRDELISSRDAAFILLGVAEVIGLDFAGRVRNASRTLSENVNAEHEYNTASSARARSNRVPTLLMTSASSDGSGDVQSLEGQVISVQHVC